ncbi:hypothetical protein JD491_01495 [Aeromonas caviae]|uniref:hypothetical protein n=1 Tax=Aeromonas TaxID=642 RepID=UPI0019206098|nr:hypothetical protein [Aeromonas caviae]MBL0576323.1 hypothetical protein [Aeromonas caviae]
MPHYCDPNYDEVLTQLDAAYTLTDRLGSEYPDNSYEEGVLDTLRWLLGEGTAPLDLALLAQEEG